MARPKKTIVNEPNRTTVEEITEVSREDKIYVVCKTFGQPPWAIGENVNMRVVEYWYDVIKLHETMG